MNNPHGKPKPFIQMQEINGTWQVLIIDRKEVVGTTTADDLETAAGMAVELYRGCLEWPPDYRPCECKKFRQRAASGSGTPATQAYDMNRIAPQYCETHKVVHKCELMLGTPATPSAPDAEAWATLRKHLVIDERMSLADGIEFLAQELANFKRNASAAVERERQACAAIAEREANMWTPDGARAIAIAEAIRSRASQPAPAQPETLGYSGYVQIPNLRTSLTTTAPALVRSEDENSVSYVQEVHPRQDPTCEHCGAIMTPQKFKCLSCGTEPGAERLGASDGKTGPEDNNRLVPEEHSSTSNPEPQGGREEVTTVSHQSSRLEDKPGSPATGASGSDRASGLLASALLKYGQHLPTCPHHSENMTSNSDCNCGFDSALARIRAAKEKQP